MMFPLYVATKAYHMESLAILLAEVNVTIVASLIVLPLYGISNTLNLIK